MAQKVRHASYPILRKMLVADKKFIATKPVSLANRLLGKFVLLQASVDTSAGPGAFHSGCGHNLRSSDAPEQRDAQAVHHLDTETRYVWQGRVLLAYSATPSFSSTFPKEFKLPGDHGQQARPCACQADLTANFRARATGAHTQKIELYIALIVALGAS